MGTVASKRKTNWLYLVALSHPTISTQESKMPSVAYPRLRLSYLSAFVGLLLLSGQFAQADNWPQWRGVGGNAVSSETSIATQWSTTKNVTWRTAMPGQGGATPAVWGDRLFVTSADGDDLVLLSIDTKNGEVLWQKKVTGRQSKCAQRRRQLSVAITFNGRRARMGLLLDWRARMLRFRWERDLEIQRRRSFWQT